MNPIFSEQEQTVRKRWLQLFITTVTVNCACAASKFFQLFPSNADPTILPYFSGTVATGLCLGMAFNYALFHFAYKKHGTKVLTASLVLAWITVTTLIVLTLGSLVSIATHRTVPFSLFYNTHSGIERVLTLGSYVFGLIFFVFSLRLRRINKAYRLRNIAK